MADRRVFLKGLAAAAVLPVRGWAAVGQPGWVAAARQADGRHALCGLDADGRITFSVPLPDRGHAAAAHPYRAEIVAFARRPGRFGLVIDCRDGAVIRRLSPPAGRQFNGHGAYASDGRLLFTSEVVAQGSAGRIGLWDVRAGYARIGEWDSHGIGPHEIKLCPDGGLAVANGGIETDPDDRKPLNLDRMRPNLALIGAEGDLVSRREMPDELAQNSIRHLALLPGGIGFAMQWQGDVAEPVPLLGIAPDGASLRGCPPPEPERFAMKAYAGSIAATASGLIAITSPRGGVVMIHRADGAHLSTLRRADICGAASRDADGFMLTDGGGAIWVADADGLSLMSSHALAWDNHLVRIGGAG
ncbi:hypothetical protein SAMN05421538_104119 [Paracoccus isoporae]|uniref:Twin-arginine translocation pathway signal n=1 Tax=Paracoccus isoporae TaxID=591205 RepID=A0A1G7AFC8_9RHOB|nr:DUF1513 domain-containing protein [Paracoccus isoporae]SDE13470.1 hypothetical protein SAMN05421538_104119 [Paracoccus isoporae]